MISPRAFLSLATCAVNSSAVPPPTFMPCFFQELADLGFASTLFSSEFSRSDQGLRRSLVHRKAEKALHVKTRERLADRRNIGKKRQIVSRRWPREF